jgi:hypothetical protein
MGEPCYALAKKFTFAGLLKYSLHEFEHKQSRSL